MNKRQKNLLLNFTLIVTVTAGFIFAMMGFKDHVNRQEAIRAMNQLSDFIAGYRKEKRHLPPKSFLDEYAREIRAARLGNLHYRALWIHHDAKDTTILAYSHKEFDSFIPSGYVVLWLNGEVEWMSEEEFEPILQKQQSEAETELLMQRENTP